MFFRDFLFVDITRVVGNEKVMLAGDGYLTELRFDLCAELTHIRTALSFGF